jgi:hypothetical protein
VIGADEARIEPDVGGVGTPGSTTVCPNTTTTYVLTAEGPGGTSSASAEVTVAQPLPDLTVDSINFEPYPPIQGEETLVSIAIRNAGAGDAGGFSWEWQAGSEAIFDGRLRGLRAGQTEVVTARWTPDGAYASLSTEARVDTDDEVEESNENNNTLAAVIQVVEASVEPEIVTIRSQGALDGYQVNDGSGSTTEDILVGNGSIVTPTGELVARGFMSFDLASIPPDATIQGAELRFYQKAVEGAPYAKLGNLQLQHVVYGDSLGADAYNTPALDSAILASQTNPGSWYVIADQTISSWLENDLGAGRSRLQLRLQFTAETDGDGEEDWIGVEPGTTFIGSSNSPQLIVTYVR